MEQNPLEQEKNNKILIVKEKAKIKMKEFFSMSKKDQEKRIAKFFSNLEIFQENGLIFDKEKLKKEFIDNIEIKDEETFISNMIKTLEPLLISTITQANIFKKIEIKNAKENREFIMNQDGNIRLSEVLYAGLSDKSAHIHLANAHDFMTKEKISDFNTDIKNGLKNLAKLIEPMKNIERITATSWIVAKSPERLENLGFTIEGELSKEEKEKHFKNETRMVHKAYIDRKRFDELYLDKSSIFE